jgi:hypothetical protein
VVVATGERIDAGNEGNEMSGSESQTMKNKAAHRSISLRTLNEGAVV